MNLFDMHTATRTPFLSALLHGMLFALLSAGLGAAEPADAALPSLRTWGCHQEKNARRQFRIESPAEDGGPGVLHVTVTASQGANHVQLTSPFSSDLLADLEVYRLRFNARAVPAREMSMHLLGHVRPWTNSGLREVVQVEADWQEYALPFRFRRPDQDLVKVDFFLGDQEGDVWIRDVSLEANPARSPVTADGPTLRTPDTQLTFGRDGAIRSLQRTNGTEDLAAGVTPPPAFALTWRKPDGTTGTTDSRSTEQMTLRENDGACAFIYHFPDLTVELQAEASPEGGIACRFKIANRGDKAITSVEFPIVHAPARLGPDSSDDCVLYPRCDGGLIEDPMRAMSGYGLSETYPGPLSCQLMAFYDSSDGFLMAALDPDGYPKRLNVRMGIDLRVSLIHLLPVVYGADVSPAYETVLMAFQGSWHTAAERYRRWAHKQPFCALPLAERDDVPDWLEKGAIVTVMNPRAKTADGKTRFTDEALEQFLAEIQEKTGLQVVPNNRGWERYGTWCGQEYFPPFPDPATFRRQAGIIRKHGVGMIMLSGFRWTIEKPQPDGSVYSSQERFDEDISRYVTHSLEGEPSVWTSDKPQDWHGTRYARLCPATDVARQIVVDAARTCVEAGYPLIHFDQEVGGCAATSFCGNATHGHPPGYGRWMHTALAALYTQIREECAPLDEDFALSMEEPNELYIPWLNLIQSRPNGLTPTFPIRRPMTRVLPLFSYLYHDYVVGWTAFYPWRSQGHHCVTLAKGFAAGMAPGLHIESTYSWQPKVREQFFTMLRNCCDIYAGEGREFLLLGRMEPPLTTDIQQRQLNMGKNGVLTVPTVYHSVWRLTDGRRAALFFNPMPDPVMVRATFQEGGDERITVPALSAAMLRLPPAP